jgi:hypothetical protein
MWEAVTTVKETVPRQLREMPGFSYRGLYRAFPALMV